MFCKNCGETLKDSDKFCLKCGTKVAKAADTEDSKPIDPSVSTEADSPKTKGQASGDSAIADESIKIQNALGSSSKQSDTRSKIAVVAGLVVIVLFFVGINYYSPGNKNEDTTATNWENYTSDDGSFSAEFPCPPEKTDDSTESSGIEMQYTQVICDLSETEAYMVQKSTFATELDTSTPQEILTNAVEGMSGTLDSPQIINSSEAVVLGHPAREYEVRGTSEGTMFTFKGRVILAGQVLYMISAAYSDTSPSETTRFIESLKLN
jgi:hypothetical protein